LRWANVKLKSGTEIRTLCTEQEQRELQTKNSLDGIAIESFEFERKVGMAQIKHIGFPADAEFQAMFEALQRYYGITKRAKVFKRVILDAVLDVGIRPEPDNLTRSQKLGYRYCQKCVKEVAAQMELIETKKAIDSHGKRKKRA